ncbi:MAG: universal stress protein [Desulfovibrionaceae bacterium]|nr:universal stress protein [Desulfovibrionaceae bacterium]
MALYERILLPVDGSAHAMHAVGQAIRIGKLGGEIILLTVMPRIPDVIGGESRKRAKEAAEKDLDQITKPIIELLKDAGVAYRKEVVFCNSPARGILQACEQTNSDVIVMGSRGCNKLEGLVLGSVTTSLLSMATVPVLVVR